ncbi:hypothetical protein BR93DRAFT_422514 [Coniochaeta sp. PMI_546]|nr:hypothetical protein BR93DRAFT_422514 [Coniochaeta sp. PMI_546]
MIYQARSIACRQTGVYNTRRHCSSHVVRSRLYMLLIVQCTAMLMGWMCFGCQPPEIFFPLKEENLDREEGQGPTNDTQAQATFLKLVTNIYMVASNLSRDNHKPLL